MVTDLIENSKENEDSSLYEVTNESKETIELTDTET